MHRDLILASSSPYRRELLGRLRLAFSVDVPAIDESARAGESPAATAERLSRAKAEAVAARHPGALVIGSDQVAEVDGVPVGKPGTHEAARAQLRAMSGRRVRFHSGVAVTDAASGITRARCVPTDVQFRVLDDGAIERYLLADLPYDCAGSAKIESLGISLVQAVHSEDPTALIGLPLIALTDLLAGAGLRLPS